MVIDLGKLKAVRYDLHAVDMLNRMLTRWRKPSKHIMEFGL